MVTDEAARVGRILLVAEALALETTEGSGRKGAQWMSVPNGTVTPQGTEGVPSVHTKHGKQVMHSPVEALTNFIDLFGRQSSSKHPEVTPTDT